MLRHKFEKRTIATEFAVLSGITLCILFISLLLVIYSVKRAVLKEEIYNLNNESQQVESTLSEIFDSLSYVMRYVGSQIVEANGEKGEIAKILAGFKEKTQVQNYLSWTVFDWVSPQNKIIINSTQGILPTPVLSDRIHLDKTCKQPGKIFFSGPNIGLVSKQRLIPAGLGVVDKNNSCLGTVNVGIVISYIADKLAKASNNQDIFLIDRHTKTVVFSTSNVNSTVNSTFEENLNNALSDKDIGYLYRPIMVEKSELRYIRTMEKYPYIILVGTPKELLDRKYYTLVYPRIVEFLLITLFCLMMLLFVYRRIVIPVTQLSDMANKVSREEVVRKLPRSKTYEFNNLAYQISKIIRLARNNKRKESEIKLANAIALESDKAKEIFLSRIRHEMRNPIAQIINFSQYILEELHGPIALKYKEYINHILDAANQLITTTSDALDLTSVDATEVIYDCVTMYRKVAYLKKVNINIAVSNKVPMIVVDEVRFKQIILGLLNRSLGQAKKNGTLINITLESTETEGKQYLVITIEDNGVGISDSESSVLLEALKIGKLNFISRKSDGTDLELPAIKKLVESHQGSLNILSQFGEGTKVILIFPYGL